MPELAALLLSIAQVFAASIVFFVAFTLAVFVAACALVFFYRLMQGLRKHFKETA